MNSLYTKKPNPTKDAFLERMKQSIPVQEIVEQLGLSKSEKAMFRHAVYYMNTLASDFADAEDIGQIYRAIFNIENEEIPNVPIMDAGNIELPTQMLKDRAVLLLVKGLIRGLEDAEVELLKHTLSLILKQEELGPAYQVIDKLRRSPQEEVVFPVETNVLEEYWELNRRKLGV